MSRIIAITNLVASRCNKGKCPWKIFPLGWNENVIWTFEAKSITYKDRA